VISISAVFGIRSITVVFLLPPCCYIKNTAFVFYTVLIDLLLY